MDRKYRRKQDHHIVHQHEIPVITDQANHQEECENILHTGAEAGNIDGNMRSGKGKQDKTDRDIEAQQEIDGIEPAADWVFGVQAGMHQPHKAD